MLDFLKVFAVVVILSSVAFAGQNVKSNPPCNKEQNILRQLEFKNSGVVTRSMHFKYFDQPCLYAETPTKWSTDWARMGQEPYPYLFEVIPPEDGQKFSLPEMHPPIGMRSAVPLGGLGAGTLELRADGSFHDWNIFNNSPGGGGQKVQLSEAMFGLRTKNGGDQTKAWVLRTHPPKDLPAIDKIEYSGAFPVSRLRFDDSDLPIKVQLYAYSEFHTGDAKSSATPAAIFSFVLHNTSQKPVQTDLMFNLPNHIKGKFEAVRSDRLGATYSLPQSMKKIKSLKLVNDVNGPTAGSMCLQVAGTDGITAASADTLTDIWADFADDGRLEGIKAEQANGAIAASVELKPGQCRTVTIVLSWYFPNRPITGENIGNFYTNQFTSAEDVAEKVLSRLPATWQAIKRWNNLCFDNDLPEWLQDALVNSPASMFVTGIWTKDGRWRQWESFSCSVLDPIHVHLYRSQPFAYFFPELLHSLLEGFVKTQRADGYVAHDLGDPPGSGFDFPGFDRQTSGIFTIGVYQYYLLTGDKEFMKSAWPAVKRATDWAIRQSGDLGLPVKLCSTYELKYYELDNAAYNSFIYGAGLLAAEKMAIEFGDESYSKYLSSVIEKTRKLIDQRFWTGNYFRAWWLKDGGYPDAIQTDTLYGQLWANLLGLEPIMDVEKLQSQIFWEKQRNDTPYGLQVLAGREPNPYLWDVTVWPAASMTWAALNIYLRDDVDESMAVAEKSIRLLRNRLCDFWDIRDVYSPKDGYPWCNSHYGRQNIFWSIPLALSGQQYNAEKKSLTFKPKRGAPNRLLWFTPVANGILEKDGKGGYKITVFAGKLELKKLSVGKEKLKIKSILELTAGQSVKIK